MHKKSHKIPLSPCQSNGMNIGTHPATKRRWGTFYGTAQPRTEQKCKDVHMPRFLGYDSCSSLCKRIKAPLCAIQIHLGTKLRLLRCKD